MSRFSAVYVMYLSIVWLFDYLYFPWLTYRFKALVFLPLYISIFLVSWGGYYLYEYFQEDVFFTEKIHAWLEQPGMGNIRKGLKTLLVNNRAFTFAAIATWWSPLHAYIFFRRDEAFKLPSFVKTLAFGSLFCALFWGAVGESFLLSWNLIRFIVR